MPAWCRSQVVVGGWKGKAAGEADRRPKRSSSLASIPVVARHDRELENGHVKPGVQEPSSPRWASSLSGSSLSTGQSVSQRRLEEPGWKRRALDPATRMGGQIAAMSRSRSTNSIRPEAAFLASMARRVAAGQHIAAGAHPTAANPGHEGTNPSPPARRAHLQQRLEQLPDVNAGKYMAAAAFLGKARPIGASITAQEERVSPRGRLMHAWASVYVDCQSQIPSLSVSIISPKSHPHLSLSPPSTFDCAYPAP